MQLSHINTDFRLILAAKTAKDWPTLNEISLARAYQHTASGQFGILTNHRAGNSPEVNRTGFYNLKAVLRHRNLGGIVLLGHWQECQDPNLPYDDCPAELKKDIAEPSLFVPNIDLATIQMLGREYDQDAIVYCGPETQNQVVLVFKDGSQQPIGRFHPNRIAQAYSELYGRKGRTFVFEWVAQNWSETMIETAARRPH